MSLQSTEISSTCDFGIPAQDVIPSRAIKLSDFLTELMTYTRQNNQISIERNLLINNELEAIREEIESKLSESSDYKNISEFEFHSTLFSDIKSYGDNILENTSEAVLSNCNASAGFRKLNFGSSSLKCKGPDLTIRIPFDDEVGNKINARVVGRETTLPSYRFIPWAVVSYVELKKLNVEVINFINQALYYSRCTLLCCPGRKFFVTAVYNIRTVVFCAVLLADDGTEMFIHSKVFSGKEASAQMSDFLSCDRSFLGFVPFFPFETCTPLHPLGRGSTATCLSVKFNETQVALKISRDCEALLTERLILKYLEASSGSLLRIPTISDMQESLLQRFPDSEFPFYNAQSIVFSPFNMNTLKSSHLHATWKILSSVHELGVCHRDVRVANIAYCQPNNNHKEVYLVDWSSAKPFRDIGVPIPSEGFRQGSSCTASADVLDRMIADARGYDCFPADEGISMIYLAYQWLKNDKELMIPRRPALAKIIWDHEPIPDAVRDCIVELRALTRKFESHHLSQIDACVLRALRSIEEMKTNPSESYMG